MLIQPDSIIRLIRDCPIDNSYKDTIYFKDSAEQKEYFYSTLSGINFTKQSYQRYAKGVLHIQAKADDIYDCNYLMFQNTAFGNKWFYAFIEHIEYVNNVSSKIYYEIDVIQTWLLDLTIHPSYIERQHAYTDGIGDNLIPESLECGEYVAGESVKYGATEMSELCVVFEYQQILGGNDVFLFGDDGKLYFIDPDKKDENGLATTYVVGGYFSTGVYGKTYSSTNYAWVELKQEGYEHIVTFFLDTTNLVTQGGLINVFMMPVDVMRDYARNTYNKEYVQILNVERPTDVIDGHIVRNNKLLTFPYCCLNIKGDSDSGKFLDFDLIGSYEPTFNGYPIGITVNNAIMVTCPLTQNANLIAYPVKYKGMEFPSEFSVQTSPYPMCKYVTDKLTEWVSNQSLSFLVKSVGAVASLFAGSVLPMAMAKSIFKENPPVMEYPQYASDYTQSARDQHAINMAAREGALRTLRRGQVGNSYAPVANLIGGALSSVPHSNSVSNGGGSSIFSTKNGGVITVSVMTIRKYAAEMIDDYFTMYGYAVNSIEKPNFNAREHFTYIKTQGFSAHGGAPSSDISKICSIHDNGITYWKKDSKVGDYSQTNRPMYDVESEMEGLLNE